jgi:hypothetical protein
VTRYPNKVYKLLGADGRTVESLEPGQLGGHSGLKIYGRLDCWSANAHVRKGTYAASRVFFKDEETAIAAGYRPCGRCMKERYALWKRGGVPGSEGYPWRILPDGKTGDGEPGKD